MSWIEEVPTGSTDPMAQGNVIKVMSLNPAVMNAVIALNRGATFGGSRLSRMQEELIATTVATLNRCRY